MLVFGVVGLLGVGVDTVSDAIEARRRFMIEVLFVLDSWEMLLS